MVTLKIANTMEDILPVLPVFENKEECEKYLLKCNYMKISDDKWICKPVRGSSKSYFPIIIVVEDAKGD